MEGKNPAIHSVGFSHKEFDPESRRAALNEAHARPSVEIGAAALVQHFAFQADQEQCHSLLRKLNCADATLDPKIALGEIDGLSVKLEKHTEFYTCTVVNKSGPDDQIPVLLIDLLGTSDFQLLSEICVSLHDNQSSLLKALPIGERHVGGRMRGGMEVRTTLKVDETGRQKFAISSGGMSSHELGRRLQRLLEMETYRVLTLLGLESARTSSSKLTELESKVDILVTQDWAETESSDNLHQQLQELSEVSARLNAERAVTRFRFSASQAYYELVIQRLKSLEEEKSGDIQTLTGFVRSRLDPAISTIRTVQRRLKDLSLEISDALSLLRTRIDVELSRSNQQSLLSMNRRHRQQLLISQTVEGLSIVAISYYGVGLLTYMIKALKRVGILPLSETLVTALAVPVVVGLVWLFIRRLRRHWQPADVSKAE